MSIYYTHVEEQKKKMIAEEEERERYGLCMILIDRGNSVLMMDLFMVVSSSAIGFLYVSMYHRLPESTIIFFFSFILFAFED